MPAPVVLSRPEIFSNLLFEKMKCINPGIEEMELYEFRYALNLVSPESGGWSSVHLDPSAEIERRINSSDFYTTIQVKPLMGDQIVLDPNIIRLAQMLFVGLVLGEYSPEWIRANFYFDIRGFYFLHRTVYWIPPVIEHLGGKPYRSFEQKQKQFERQQSIGYREFKEANTEVDQAFIESVKRLIAIKGIPILMAIAGPTAAGKTEIVERLCTDIRGAGQKVSSIEMDNFLTDRDQREQKGIFSLGREAIHFDLFKQALGDLRCGRKAVIPRYDFLDGSSSHELDGYLKTGRSPVEIDPADIIFIEGNFPFLIPEITPLIGIKAVYLTDDDIRLKRKWKRDVDYRKKYDTSYLRNRFFREQFLMAEKCYLPQMELCDLLVDTSGAALWATSETAQALAMA